MQRLAAQARGGWSKESRNLRWFGVKDRMSVLEAGSGPGFVTSQLLELLPNSTITCVESDAGLISQAKDWLADEHLQRVRFVEASIIDTGLADNQIDVVYARFLFQHLLDPLAAAREIRRILKPGGRLIVLDIDDGLFGLFQPTILGLEAIVSGFGQAQAERGGNRHIGRDLWTILDKSGYCDIDIEVLASHSGRSGIEPFMQQLDADRFESLVVGQQISAQTLAQFRQSRDQFLRAADASAFWLSLMFCARKPGG